MGSISGVTLPIEVWERIFSNLTTSDIINFCSTSSEYKDFLRQKPIIQNFNICGNYFFTEEKLYKYIKENTSYKYIKTLNINKLYWISLAELRSLLKSLTNLEELLALNTALGFRIKDVELYGNLKTLALSVNMKWFLQYVDQQVYKNKLYMLRKLCLQIVHKDSKAFMQMSKLFIELYALDELWIYDADNSSTTLRYDSIVAHMKFLKKLVIISDIALPFLDYKPYGLAKYFHCMRFKPIVMAYENLPVDQIVPFRKISIFEPIDDCLEHAWNTLIRFNSEMPFSATAHKKIYVTKQLHSVQFRELNFFHHKNFCAPDYIKAIFAILLSNNSKDLRKLSAKSCILLGNVDKKSRNLADRKAKFPFLDVLKNCPNVECLELRRCSKDVDSLDLDCNVTILDTYSAIEQWKNLQRLTLELGIHINGKFLTNVLINCSQLKFLHIISNGTNESLNRNVYQALRYAHQLEDFSYEVYSCNLHKLFDSLATLTSRKLRRIFIQTISCETCSLTSMEQFINGNPQLIFLNLIISTTMANFRVRINDLLKSFYKRESVKTFCLKKSRDSSAMPLVHRDLYDCESEVSTITIYDFKLVARKAISQKESGDFPTLKSVFLSTTFYLSRVGHSLEFQ